MLASAPTVELPIKRVLGTLTPCAPFSGITSWSFSLGGAVCYSYQEDIACINSIYGIKWGHWVLFQFRILFWQLCRYEDKQVKAVFLDVLPWNPSCNSSSLLFTTGETHPKRTATWSLCVIKLPTFMPYALPVHRINVIIRQQRKSAI